MKEKLTEDERRVYGMSASMTPQNIAQIVGHPVQWVRDRIRRAERKLGAGYKEEK